MIELLQSLGRELVKALIYHLEWSQLAWIDLSDGFGSTFASSTSSVGLRAPEGDFFEFGPLWLLVGRVRVF